MFVGLGFRLQDFEGVGFSVCGFRSQDLWVMSHGFRFCAHCWAVAATHREGMGFRVQGSGLKIQGSGSRV